MLNAKALDVNSPRAVRAAGFRALREALGSVGMVRFLQQFDDGHGDYTKEKYEMPEQSLDEIEAEIEKMRTLEYLVV